jgi:hypothetical protein
LLSACLDLEYHYTLMYSFAPASYALQHHAASETSTDERLHSKVAALTRLAEKATSASYQMLSIFVNLGPSNLLRYLPVRCWVFIVAANLHLLKVAHILRSSAQRALSLRNVRVSANGLTI